MTPTRPVPSSNGTKSRTPSSCARSTDTSVWKARPANVPSIGWGAPTSRRSPGNGTKVIWS